MLAPVVAHDDDCHVRPGGERCGLLHSWWNRVVRMFPTQAHLATNQSRNGKRPWNGSVLLWPIGGIVDAQRMRLTGNQMQRHRLGYQGDARIVDEELTIEIQTGRPQMGQRERIVPGRRWSDTACPPNGESVGELLRRLQRGCIK